MSPRVMWWDASESELSSTISSDPLKDLTLNLPKCLQHRQNCHVSDRVELSDLLCCIFGKLNWTKWKWIRHLKIWMLGMRLPDWWTPTSITIRAMPSIAKMTTSLLLKTSTSIFIFEQFLFSIPCWLSRKCTTHWWGTSTVDDRHHLTIASSHCQIFRDEQMIDIAIGQWGRPWGFCYHGDEKLSTFTLREKAKGVIR